MTILFLLFSDYFLLFRDDDQEYIMYFHCHALRSNGF
jgi:hypothetical protein